MDACLHTYFGCTVWTLTLCFGLPPHSLQVYDAVRKEFELRGAYFLTEEEKVKVRGA